MTCGHKPKCPSQVVALSVAFRLGQTGMEAASGSCKAGLLPFEVMFDLQPMQHGWVHPPPPLALNPYRWFCHGMFHSAHNLLVVKNLLPEDAVDASCGCLHTLLLQTTSAVPFLNMDAKSLQPGLTPAETWALKECCPMLESMMTTPELQQQDADICRMLR